MRETEELRLMQAESTDLLMRTALDLGEHLLLSGGDIHRIEDTITRICRVYGAEHVEVFCIPSTIIASVRMPSGEYVSQMRRVYSCTNNLASLEALNEISREICAGSLTLPEASVQIKKVKNLDPYPHFVYYVAGCVVAATFALFSGGNARDAIASAVAGLVVMWLDRHRPKDINAMMQTVIVSFIGGVMANLTVLIGIGEHIDMVRIGMMMLLVPGLAFGNAIQDLLGGDLLAGSVKLVQAVMLAVMIALGLAFSMILFGGVL